MYNSMRNKYMKLSDSPANVKRQQFFYFIFFLALSSREYTNKLECRDASNNFSSISFRRDLLAKLDERILITRSRRDLSFAVLTFDMTLLHRSDRSRADGAYLPPLTITHAHYWFTFVWIRLKMFTWVSWQASVIRTHASHRALPYWIIIRRES